MWKKIRRAEDKTLRRLAPITIAESGRPRVLILDTVFQKGEELHKDFIICYFNGRPPPFNQIQSVVNHMWGKGKRVEIHNNPLSYSMLVRIPSAYLRQKIIEKSFWYVGESMFHAVQWSSKVSFTSPPLDSIQILAHLTGVPLDLHHEESLSLIAGLVGDPKETGEFTKNLLSLTLSHVKVVVDLTKPLPSVVEFQRQSGEVVEVMVSYPWLTGRESVHQAKAAASTSEQSTIPIAASKTSETSAIASVDMELEVTENPIPTTSAASPKPFDPPPSCFLPVTTQTIPSKSSRSPILLVPLQPLSNLPPRFRPLNHHPLKKNFPLTPLLFLNRDRPSLFP